MCVEVFVVCVLACVPTHSHIHTVLWLLYIYMLFFSHTNKKKIFRILPRPEQVPAVTASINSLHPGIANSLIESSSVPPSPGHLWQ